MPTVTSQQGSEFGNNTPPVTSNQSGLSTGAAVGVAVGVLGFLVILGAFGVFFWLRRRKQKQEEAMVERSNSGRGSSAGMMSTPRTEMASIWDSEQLSMGRRNSRLMPHDPRMDPFAGGLYGAQNKSRESINTIQDNQDYSRKVLRTTNPDPPDRE
jgi:cell wall integrity and stress response component